MMAVAVQAGIGSRLSTAAVTCRKPRNASAGPEPDVSGRGPPGVECGRGRRCDSDERRSTEKTLPPDPAAAARLCAASAAERVGVQVYGAAGQADTALDDEQQRQHDRQHRVRVLERVERQVAGGLDARGRPPDRRRTRGANSWKHSDTTQPPSTNTKTPKSRARAEPRPRDQASTPPSDGDRDEREEQRAGAHGTGAPAG